MELLLFWFGIAVITGMAAEARGRSGFGWFILGLLFSLLALLAVLVIGPTEERRAAKTGAPKPSRINVSPQPPLPVVSMDRWTAPAVETKPRVATFECPACGGVVKSRDRFCSACGTEMEWD